MRVEGESENGGVKGWELGLLYCPSDTENGNPRRHGGWIGGSDSDQNGERSKGNDGDEQDFWDLNQVMFTVLLLYNREDEGEFYIISCVFIYILVEYCDGINTFYVVGK